MVTQIYMPPPAAFSYKKPVAAPTSEDEETSKAPGSQAPISAVASALEDQSQRKQQQSGMLGSAKELTQKEKIGIQTVLTDFQRTMAALGVSDSVKEEVLPYLQVITHQARRDKPSVGLIKEHLKIAARTLDSYISETLNQPSNVVEEWVGALLMQQIDYQCPDCPAIQGPNGSSMFKLGNEALDDVLNSAISSKLPLTKEERASFKQLNRLAQKSVQAGDYNTALQTYDQASAVIANKNQHEMEGQLNYQRGQALVKAGKPADACEALMKANEQIRVEIQPKLKAKVCKALGSLMLQTGELDDAQKYLEQSLMLESQLGDEAAKTQSLFYLGNIASKQRQWPEAQTHFNAALDRAKTFQPKLEARILGELGWVTQNQGNFKEAFGLYKQALQGQLSKTQNSKVWQHLASLYLQMDKPDKALKALQKVSQ